MIVDVMELAHSRDLYRVRHYYDARTDTLTIIVLSVSDEDKEATLADPTIKTVELCPIGRYGPGPRAKIISQVQREIARLLNPIRPGLRRACRLAAERLQETLDEVERDYQHAN
jgi:hypothetical protein